MTAKFEFTRIPATLKRKTDLSSGTMPMGKNGMPVKVVETELHLNIALTKLNDAALKSVDKLFPNMDVVAKVIASRGEDNPTGLDVKARGKLGPVTFTMHYGDEAEPLIDTIAQVKARPGLKIDEKGDVVMEFRPRVRVPDKQATAAWECLGSDGLFISVKPSQTDIGDLIQVGGNAEKKKAEKAAGKGKGKKKGEGEGEEKKADPFAEEPAGEPH